MQDQGKRILLAVTLAMGVWVVWTMIFPQPKDEPPAHKTLTTGSDVAVIAPSRVGVASQDTPAAPPTVPAVGSGSDAGSAAPAVAPAPVEQPAVAAPRGPEQLIHKSYPNLSATFSSYGGVLTSWKLADKRYVNDPHKGELVPPQPDAGAFRVNFNDSTYVIPANAEWTPSEPSPDVIVYHFKSSQLDVTKTFKLDAANYMVTCKVDYTVIGRPASGAAKEALALTAFEFQNPKDDGGGSGRVEARVWSSSTLRVDGKQVSTAPEEILKGGRYETRIRWTGFEHPYLLVGFAPRLRDDADNVEKHTFPVEPRGLMETDILFGASTNPTGSQEVAAYLGPKNYTQLDNADAAVGFNTGFRSVVDLGWFGFIGKPLLWLLQRLYSFAGNWGVAIILLTLLVKLATLYWTTKSMRSMKAMAALAPKMKELQAKYADDKQRQQAETMALYKQYNVNPLAGCLPIVLQMPIWLALYRMLSSAGELYQQPFIPGWINDLTNVDPYHILPVILVITMFVQARLQPATATGPQQKMMQYGMPLGFGVMSFFFPAGLTLYIFTNTLLSALHSLYMNKYDKASLASAALLKQETSKTTASATAATLAKAGVTPKAKAVAVAIEATDAVPAADDDDDDDSPAAPGAPGPARARSSKANKSKKNKGRKS